MQIEQVNQPEPMEINLSGPSGETTTVKTRGRPPKKKRRQYGTITMDQLKAAMSKKDLRIRELRHARLQPPQNEYEKSSSEDIEAED